MLKIEIASSLSGFSTGAMYLGRIVNFGNNGLLSHIEIPLVKWFCS